MFNPFRPESFIDRISKLDFNNNNQLLRGRLSRKESHKLLNKSGSDILVIDVKHPIHENKNKSSIAICGAAFEILLKCRNRYIEGNEAFKQHYEFFKFLLENTYIFARMSPDHKTFLVEALKNEEMTVSMCGDGANDCGALKAADVGKIITNILGVSLSIEEASIAAHFTSNIPNISCLIKLFREGKASLVTSIQCFKYMMLYCLVQFIAVTLLIIFNSYLTDFQFLASDLFIIFPVAILISR